MSFNIGIDDRELKRWLLFANKQIPYATALALSTLAWKARGDLQDEAERSLTIRRGYPIKGRGGITSIRADKKNLARGAVVGSPLEMMAVLATGGKRPTAAPIPMTADRGDGGDGYPRDTMKAMVRRKDWISRAAKRKDKATGTSNRFLMRRNGIFGLWERKGEPVPRQRQRAGKSGKSRMVRPSRPLRLLYKISKEPANIEQRWDFYRTVERSVVRHWPRAAEDAAMRSLDTRKAKR